MAADNWAWGTDEPMASRVLRAKTRPGTLRDSASDMPVLQRHYACLTRHEALPMTGLHLRPVTCLLHGAAAVMTKCRAHMHEWLRCASGVGVTASVYWGLLQ